MSKYWDPLWDKLCASPGVTAGSKRSKAWWRKSAREPSYFGWVSEEVKFKQTLRMKASQPGEWPGEGILGAEGGTRAEALMVVAAALRLAWSAWSSPSVG